MAARYLLDTDICIYIHRKQSAAVLDRFQRLAPGEAIISIISYGELLFGAEKSVRRASALQILEEFTEFVKVAPLSNNVARTYGAIRASLEIRGTPIGSNDLWIAAHAVAADLMLVTNNEREFKRVNGLKIENWIG